LDGGVFLAGRYVFEAIDHTDWTGFRERFEAKGRLSGFVKALPAWALANPASVLIGAAHKLGRDAGSRGEERPAAVQDKALPRTRRSARVLPGEVLQGAACGLLVLDDALRIVAANERFWQGASAPAAK